jgi:hypothetical protein
MRGRHDSELERECIKLRTDKNFSLREIHEATGAPKGTLSAWLKEHPLPEHVKREKHRNSLKTRNYEGKRKSRGVISKFLAMIDINCLTREQKGNIAESAILFRLCLFGFSVLGPIFDGNKSDWVVLSKKSGKVYKIQVKYVKKAINSHGLPMIPLTSSGNSRVKRHDKRYKEGDFDFIVGYDLYSDTAYVFSWVETIKLKTTVTITPESAERWDKII